MKKVKLLFSFALYYLGLNSAFDVCRPILRQRRCKLLSSRSQLQVNPSEYNGEAILIGSGQSVNHLLFGSGVDLFRKSYKLVLNTGVFSGLKYNLAMYEMAQTRQLRTHYLDMISHRDHKVGALDNSLVILTNVSAANFDDHIVINQEFFDYVAPHSAIHLPKSRSRRFDGLIRIMARGHFMLSSINILPPLLLLRCSAVRSLILLCELGFSVVHLVGFDGDTSYFYDDVDFWPSATRLRAMRKTLKSSSPLSEIVGGNLVSFDNSRYVTSEGVHRTADPNLGQYTFRALAQIIADTFSVKLVDHTFRSTSFSSVLPKRLDP